MTQPQHLETTNAALLPGLSFVFPMFNEIGNIERCVEEALKTGYKLTRDLEIVVVDDASTDGCGALADALAYRHSELKVLHHAKNRKLGGALQTGFAAATKDWVLYIDSDLPIDMDEALRAVPLLQNAEMVIGNRQGRAEGLKREAMSWVYNRLIRVLFGLNVRDVNFAFKMFRRSILEQITLRSEGSFIDAELLIETHKAGFRIAELPIRYFPRVAGVSTLASSSVVVKILGELWAYRRRAAARKPRPALPPHP
ncbi:MAG: glycosyltransferase family 2 protein [Armatimonadota bacterium]|nr:glycosyltransferase family 2 protein [Armatimonadota bacterium]